MSTLADATSSSHSIAMDKQRPDSGNNGNNISATSRPGSAAQQLKRRSTSGTARAKTPVNPAVISQESDDEKHSIVTGHYVAVQQSESEFENNPQHNSFVDSSNRNGNSDIDAKTAHHLHFNNPGLQIDGAQYPPRDTSILLQSKEYLDEKIFPVLLPGLEQLLVHLQKQVAEPQSASTGLSSFSKVTSASAQTQQNPRIKDPVHWLAQVRSHGMMEDIMATG